MRSPGVYGAALSASDSELLVGEHKKYFKNPFLPEMRRWEVGIATQLSQNLTTEEVITVG